VRRSEACRGAGLAPRRRHGGRRAAWGARHALALFAPQIASRIAGSASCLPRCLPGRPGGPPVT